MRIIGDVECNVCGQIIKANNVDYLGCDNGHFKVRLNDIGTSYRAIDGMTNCYTVKEKLKYYEEEDFTQLNDECFELINEIKNLGAYISLTEKEGDDGIKFIETISSDMCKRNRNDECTTLDLTIYLDTMFNNTTEGIIERLKKYIEILKMINNEELDLNDRDKIDKLQLHLDAEDKRKKLYDTIYYF